ncbi:MAG TPA: hypothetical protein VLM88_11465, partial [Proteiniclasticum sp.]|nr:hypothetical protein [Proteiniclasticum sp.]
MKKTAWLYKVLVFVFIIILIYAFFRMSFIISENNIKNEIIESVHDNLDGFNSYSMKVMNDEISSGEFEGFQVQQDHDYPDIIN